MLSDDCGKGKRVNQAGNLKQANTGSRYNRTDLLSVSHANTNPFVFELNDLGDTILLITTMIQKEQERNMYIVGGERGEGGSCLQDRASNPTGN